MDPVDISSHAIFKDLSVSLPGSLSCASNIFSKHGENLFVAAGNVVRWTQLKKGISDFKTLKMPMIDFPIKSLVINKMGSILLMVGEKKIFACSLPLSYTYEDTRVRYQEIGARYSTDRIVKVIFNPIARFDANIIILRESSSILAFDLSTSYDTPDLIYDIAEFSKERGRVFSSADPLKFISMDLGNDSVPNGLFTLFLLSEDNDIYTICPWLPSAFLLTESQINDTYDSAVINKIDKEDAISTDQKLLRKQLQKQLLWARNIKLESQSNLRDRIYKTNGGMRDERHIIKRSNNLAPVIQGPLLMQPFPDALYSEVYDQHATDMEIINLGFMSAIFVSLENGRVFTLLQDRPIIAQWKGDDLGDLKQSLIFLLSFKLDVIKKDPSSMKFWSSLCNNHVIFFSLNQNEVVQLDCTPWSNELFETIQQGAKSITNIVQNLKLPKFHRCIHSKSAIRGLFFAKTTDLQDRLFYCDSNGLIDCGTVAKTEKRFNELDRINGMDDLNKKMDELDLTHVYDSVLLKASFDEMVTELLESKMELPSLPMDLTKEITDNLENLQYFEVLTNSYRQQVGSLLKASLTLHRKVYLQRMEVHQQLQKLQMIAKHVKGNVIKDVLKEKEKKIREKQEELENRAKVLVDRLSQTRDIPLSNKEKDWSAQLTEYENEINRENDGLAVTSEHLMKETAVIINELSRNTTQDIEPKNHAEKLVSTDEQKAILQFLAKMDRHINQTQKKLSSILERMSRTEN